MLKTLLTPACAMALLFAGGNIATAQNDSKTAAQSSQETKDTSKTVTNNGSSKTGTTSTGSTSTGGTGTSTGGTSTGGTATGGTSTGSMGTSRSIAAA